MKKLLILVCVTQLLSSCFTYHSLTKRGEPVPEDIRLIIQPSKRYNLKLKSGKELLVDVERVDSLKIYGEFREIGYLEKHSYEDTFENLQKNLVRIEIRKFNPVLTTVLYVIPISLAIYFGIQAAGYGAFGS